MEKILNYINGELVASSSGRWLETMEPATATAYGQITDSDTTDLVHMFTPGATEDLVTLDGTNTAGGLGCWIQYIDLATDVWSVQIIEGVGGTAPATPFTST